MQEILDRFPQLRVSLEHISTKEAAEFIRQHGSPDRVATITPQHLVSHIGRAMYTTDGAYMPCAKDIEDMLALQKLIAEGCPWVHLGTDGAPHVEEAKCAVQCACGAFTPHAPELYLEAFTQAGCLEYFEEFACLRGPRFFGLDPKPGTMVFQRQKWQFDEFFTVPETGELIRPFGFRTCEEEDRHLGVNRTMTWRRQT